MNLLIVILFFIFQSQLVYLAGIVTSGKSLDSTHARQHFLAGGRAQKTDNCPAIIPNKVSYSINVQPILARHCFPCHNYSSSEKNFVDSEQMQTNLRLWKTIVYFTGNGLMPPPGSSKLTNCDKLILRKWKSQLE